MTAEPTRQHQATLSSEPWGRWGVVAVGLLVLAGLGLRLWHLGAEGFADDEVHKWLAACRYLQGDFGGDDLEHPMLMKALIALWLRVFPAVLSPEAATRLPEALSGGVLVWAVAGLGRRLFGRAAGLLAAAVVALSPTAVGYGRVAKEDALLALFTVLLVRCLAEAHAVAEDSLADGRREAPRPPPRGRIPAHELARTVGARCRWEIAGALALGAAFASKYQIAVAFLPPLTYAWLRAGGARWRVPARRWALLAVVATAAFLALDWVVLRPSTWSYIARYIAGDRLGDRGKSESLVFLGRSYDNLAFHFRGGVPTWFYLAFAAFKLAPPTVALATGGIGLAVARRAPAHRILLAWLGVYLLAYVVMSAKYGRYFLPILPAFALLAAHAAVELSRRSPRPGAVLGALALVTAGAEALAVLPRLPHPRLYVSFLGGGDAAVDTAFPHCDYFDAGVREAVADIAARAEPGAQIASDTPWLTRYYAARDGRPDLTVDRIVPGAMCLRDAPCYVVVQRGRRYWHNEAVLDALAPRTPWATFDVGGHHAVAVHRIPSFDPSILSPR